MLDNMMIILLLMMTMIFIQLNNPLSMGLILMIKTVLICLLMKMNETFWFSYILFLVFMGGMLILFIYVTSLASNDMFNMNTNMYILCIMMMLSLMILLYLYDNMLTNTLFPNQLKNMNSDNFMNLIKLFNYPTNMITIMLMNYLLIALIAIVKITNIFYGPLRQMSN